MASIVFEFVYGDTTARMVQDVDGLFQVYSGKLHLATTLRREDAAHLFRNEVAKLTAEWERTVT